MTYSRSVKVFLEIWKPRVFFFKLPRILSANLHISMMFGGWRFVAKPFAKLQDVLIIETSISSRNFAKTCSTRWNQWVLQSLRPSTALETIVTSKTVNLRVIFLQTNIDGIYKAVSLIGGLVLLGFALYTWVEKTFGGNERDEDDELTGVLIMGRKIVPLRQPGEFAIINYNFTIPVEKLDPESSDDDDDDDEDWNSNC